MSEFNLKSYLQRIGFAGDTTPSLKLLNEITSAHAKSIAFENVDVMLGRRIHLSDDALFEKLVTKGRGGYCFEQNGLLLRVLSELGFEAKPISARVRLRFATRDEVAPRTHVLLRVEIDGESYLTDVGMGAASLTKALSLRAGVEQETPHDLRRLDHAGNIWYHQIRYTDVWNDACEFTLEEMPLIDREIANWYTSTHPQSHFRDRIVAARAVDNGERISLQNLEFTRRPRGSEAQKSLLRNADEVIEVLTKYFGLELTATDRDQIRALDFTKLG